MTRFGVIIAMPLLAAMPAFAAAPSIALKAQVMVEQRRAATDGTTRIVPVRADRVTPGDAVIYTLTYRNTGDKAAADLVIANPVPANLLYAGASENSPAPEVSADGATFAPLAQLRVGGRAATNADVRAVRWRLAGPLPGGAEGTVAYRAILK